MAAHRYWALVITGVVDAGDDTTIAELQMAISLGGGNVVSGGTAFSEVGGVPANWADGSTATEWQNAAFNSHPHRIYYDFGSGNAVDINNMTIVAGSFNTSQAPNAFHFQFSDDGVSWTTTVSHTGELGWSSLEARTFDAAQAAAPETGTTVLNVNHKVVIGVGTPSLILEHALLSLTGISGLLIRHAVEAAGTTSLTLNHAVVQKTGATALSISHLISSVGPSLVTLNHVPQQATPGAHWHITILVDGIDVSARITGSINITAEQGAARISSFIMKPLAGIIDAQEWVKKPVKINYETFIGSVLQTNHRRFTGIVNLATYDPATRLITFECSDDLQGSLEALNFSDIDAVIGGLYSPAIFNETDNGWEYAQQRLESQSESYDKDHDGSGRKWPWLAKVSPDITLIENSIVDGSLTLTQNTSRDIINKVTVNLDYRYSRRWQRELKIIWNYNRTFEQYLILSSDLPNRDMFMNSINSSWWIKRATFTKLPASGEVWTSNGPVGWFISDELREQLIFGANATIAKRWLQDLTEQFSIVVKNDASIARFGVIDTVNKYAVDSEPENEFEAESKGTVKTLGVSATSNTYVSTDYQDPVAGSIAIDSDFYADQASRATFNDAVKTAIAIAKTDILKSHHQNEVSAQILIDPEIDLGKTLFVNVAEIQAQGTVGRYVETFNLNEGSALCVVSINVYAPNVPGQNDDAVAVPVLPDTAPISDGSNSLSLDTHLGGNNVMIALDEDWRGFIGNYAGITQFNAVTYPVEFRTEIPEVNALNRDKAEYLTASIVDAAIPEETLIINA